MILLDLAKKYDLEQVGRIIESAQEIHESKHIDVAILGQFKAGKSSLINSLINRDILPTGVIPVTAIISELFYSPSDQIIIKYLHGKEKQITADQLKDYVTEAANPNNGKQVASAYIGIPEMKLLQGIRLIDTPGLGSIFVNNTETTQQWSPQTTIALIVISAERPLSEQDKQLLEKIKRYSYKTYCVLSKVDLFTDDQISQITQFVSSALDKTLGTTIPILQYSTKQDTDKYKQQLYKTVFQPLLASTSTEIEKIYNHKLSSAALLLENYLKIALEVSIKTEQEHKGLKNKIFNTQTSANFLYQQVQLIASDLKSQTRHSLEELLLPHKYQLVKEIQQIFNQEYYTWSGNLYQISRKYESWLKETLKTQILDIINIHKAEMDRFIFEATQRLSFFTDTFSENLRKKIHQSLGIEIHTLQWQANLHSIHTPDISVYRAFESNIDLLWFLFPMAIFRNFFGRHLLKQIPLEIEKNLYRVTSILTGMINNEIENLAQQAIQYINQYIDTITKALTAQRKKIKELETDLKSIKQASKLIK